MWAHLWALNIASIYRSYIGISYFSISALSFVSAAAAAVWLSCCCVCLPSALLSIHSPPLVCLLLNLKARGSVTETARLREVISSSKQTAALYNTFSARINCMLPARLSRARSAAQHRQASRGWIEMSKLYSQCRCYFGLVQVAFSVFVRACIHIHNV